MKKIFLISLLVFPLVTSASTITAVASGNWSFIGTWNPTTIPIAGDEVIIPPGITVTLDIGTPLLLRVINNGTLVLSNSGLSVLVVSQNIYNNNSLINYGVVFVHGSLFNADTI